MAAVVVIRKLDVQIEELEMDKVEEKTQEVTLRTADAAAW